MGKILCFIYEDMADFEMTLPLTVAGLWLEKELITVAYEKEIIKSKPGVQYMPHSTVKEALDFEDVDGLIIPGGWNDEQRPELTQLIQKLDKESKMLAAICAGPQYLARANVLDNKRYTTTLTKEYMDSQGKDDFFPRETFVNENVVRDRNIITAVGRAFVDFAIEIADYFEMFSQPDSKLDKVTLANHYKGL